jgi:predicted nucleic acid-binding protein
MAARAPDQIAISIVTLAELHFGAVKARSERLRADIVEWITSEIEPRFADRTLPLSMDILVEWLQLGRQLRSAGQPRDTVDVLIAATARVHDLILVTRNARDFANTGIVVYDPWSGKTHRMDAP